MATKVVSESDRSHNDGSAAGGAQPVDAGRRRFLTITTGVVGAAGVAAAAVPFVKSWMPSARAKLAGAPVTVDISALTEGQRIIAEWRGQPIWIVKRSKAILDALPSLDANLADPNSENLDQQPKYIKGENRSVKADISVLVGLCTHLGCSPEMKAEIRPEPFDSNWKGGYFCPCHKSKFDMAGRVYAGVPAPTNLVVPPHYYENDATLVIGVDPKGGA
jgi:ubiquinol-cytochrome c reductase iron-sulfur subunit